MKDQYRIVRIAYEDGIAHRFVSSWTSYDQACRILRTLIDNGDNAFIESYNGGSR